MKKPFLKISDHPVTGKARGIQLQSVTYLDYDLGEAKLAFEEMLLDEKKRSVIKETRGYNIENVEFLDGLGEFQYRDPFSEVSEVPKSIKIYISELAKYL